MSSTLFFLVPIGMLAVVWSLCFVGACFPTGGLPSPYSDNVLNDQNLVAYWPLNDLINPLNMQGQTSGATDLTGNGHTGTYMVPFPLTNSPLSMPFSQPSVARKPSIIPGEKGSTKNPLPASADFEGAFISIPWNTANSSSPQLSQFTVEAWINPTLAGTGDLWVLFSALINNTGFVIFIDENKNWKFTIGTGAASSMFPSAAVPGTGTLSVTPGTTIYIAVTCDASGVLSLWVDPSSDTANPPTPTWTSQVPTGYVATDMSQPVTFFIGAGANDQTVRTQMNGPGAPLLPFQGQVQSVALYKVALGATELQSHFETGATT